MTMPNDINNLDSEDIGLKQIFGDRFHDETEPVKVESKKVPENITKALKAGASHARQSAEDIGKFPNTKPDFHKRIWNSAKSAVTFGGLNLLIFYWAQTGLMAESIAVPSMCVCAALAGWSVGKNFARS